MEIQKRKPLYEEIGFLRQEIVTQNPIHEFLFLTSEIPKINKRTIL